jgi:WD40 repeat protein
MIRAPVSFVLLALLVAIASAEGAAPPPFRVDAQGDLLPSGALQRLGSIRFRHCGPVRRVAITRDGKTILSGGGNNRVIRFFRTSDGKQLCEIPEEDGTSTLTVALSPDDRMVLTVGNNHDANVWDFTTCKKVVELKEPDGLKDCWAACWSPDGKKVCTVCSVIRIYSIPDGRLLRKFGTWAGHDTVAWSGDGHRLAVGTREGKVELWDPDTGKEIAKLPGGTAGLSSLVFSPDSRILAWADNAGMVRLWDLRANKFLREWKSGRRFIAQFAFTPEGDEFALLDKQGSISFWGVTTGKERPVPGALGMVRSVQTLAFSGNGSLLVTGSPDGTIRVWDRKTGRELSVHDSFNTGTHQLALSADGSRVFLVKNMRQVGCWDLPSGKHLWEFEPNQPGYGEWGLHPTGRGVNLGFPRATERSKWALISLGDDGKVRSRFDGDSAEVRPFCFLPGGRRVLVGRGRAVCCLGMVDGKEEFRLHDGEANQNVLDLSLSADGSRLAVTRGPLFNPLFLEVWDVAGRRILLRYKPPVNSAPDDLALSPNGERLAFGLATGRVILFDLRNGQSQEWQAFPKQSPNNYRITFSPDSQTLAVTGMDRTVRLWDVATRTLNKTLESPAREMAAAVFTPDGRRLITTGNDAALLVWDLTGHEASGLPLPATDAEIRQRWQVLAGDDAAQAYQALWDLADAPARALPFLRAEMRPVPLPDAKRLNRLIADLDADEFAVREQARMELESIGDVTEPALQRVKDSESLEVRGHVRRLLERIAKGRISPSGEALRTLRAVEVLLRMKDPAARRLLGELAAGAEGASLTRAAQAALARLALAGKK